MAEVRCPMCGKPNPPEQETCQYCQARLKPLVGPSGGEGGDVQPPAPRPQNPVPAQPEDETNAGLPDWLNSLRPDDEGQSDYLGDNQSDDQGLGDSELPAGFESGESELPDWLRAEDTPREAAPPAFESIPDWLSTGEGAGTSAGEPNENEPDWTPSGAAFESEAPELSSSEHESPEAEPDWLRQIRQVQHPTDTPEGEAPEWMPQAPSTPPFETSEADFSWQEGAFPADESLAASLSAFDAPDKEIPASDGEAQTGQPAVEIPSNSGPALSPEDERAALDWLAGYTWEKSSVGSALDAGVPDWLPKPEQPAELPPGAPGLPTGPGGAPPFILPDSSASKESAAQPEPDELEGLYSEEMPDWLLGASPAAPASSPQSDSGLAPAELPGWLEAMRPSGSRATPVASVDANAPVEGSGPLSGLRGVLPAEASLPVKKSAGYSVKLQVSEGQQAHTQILEELIRTEGEARPVPGRSLLSSQAVLRVAIFLILLVAVGLPVLTASQDSPLPALPPETRMAVEAINALPAAAPVLAAVDFQPGLSGELDAASGAVLDHLMIKGAYLTLVSTSINGPILAERLVGEVSASGGHQYQVEANYTNLGFIPGGTTGLLGFASAPRRIMPFALDGKSPWEPEAGLQEISGLSDFKLVLVITDNPETAQAWIEQVQPSLGETPMLMVVSAQAEPIVRPYVEGIPRQVRGLVTGLAGGAAYEAFNARPGLARKYWDSFSLGLLAAAGLIVAGGLINLIALSFSNRRRSKGGKPG